MQHQNSTLSTPNAAIQAAISDLLDEVSFAELQTHLLELMCFLTAEYDYSDFSQELKQSIWWKNLALSLFLTKLHDATQNQKEVTNGND